MDNDETILDELINFEQKKTNKIPQILDDYLKEIAKTGEIIYPWKQIQPLFTCKLQQVIEDFHDQCPTEHLPPSPNVEIFKYDMMKDKLVEATYSFNCAPFTIQRLCELLTSPTKHYKQTDKFMRGIEKNMLVVSASQSSRRSIDRSYDHNNSVMLNGVAEQLPENGSSSVQLASFVTAFTPGNDRLQHTLSNHNQAYNNLETKSVVKNDLISSQEGVVSCKESPPPPSNNVKVSLSIAIPVVGREPELPPATTNSSELVVSSSDLLPSSSSSPPPSSSTSSSPSCLISEDADAGDSLTLPLTSEKNENDSAIMDTIADPPPPNDQQEETTVSSEETETNATDITENKTEEEEENNSETTQSEVKSMEQEEEAEEEEEKQQSFEESVEPSAEQEATENVESAETVVCSEKS